MIFFTNKMVTLDYIWIDSAELFGPGREPIIQNENCCLKRDLIPSPAVLDRRSRPLGHTGKISSGQEFDSHTVS